MPGQLSDDDLRDAAAEAGVSPGELRDALVRREPDALATRPTSSVVGRPRRGETATFVEDHVAAPPEEARQQAQIALEQSTGLRGHAQPEDTIDVVDDRAGITYRIRATDDGWGGALVRIDVDPSGAKAERVLATTGIGVVGAAVAALGLIFHPTILFTGVAVLGLAALNFLRSTSSEHRAVRTAHQVAARSLTRTQHEVATPLAPPADQ